MKTMLPGIMVAVAALRRTACALTAVDCDRVSR
jgi:hypothetical protein